jgi:IclR family transcriptional regulator, KDG regulon repressor
MIQLVERASRILESFTREHPELTLSECAELANLTKSSAHRLLTSLAAVELVEREGNLWRLGPGVVRLASVRLGHFDLRREAVPQLRELGRHFRAAVAFSVPHGSEMVYLERFESPEPIAATAQLGARAPIWAGAAGQSVLAALPVAVREERLDVSEWRGLPFGTRKRVLDEIKRGERRRYVVDPGNFFAGIAGVAIAVRDHHDFPIAALSVISSPEGLSKAQADAIGTRLVSTADELEQFARDWFL